MKKIIENLLCYIIIASMFLACVPGIALAEESNITTIFDFNGKTLNSEYYDAKYYPKLDGSRLTSLIFSTKGTLAAKEIDGETVLAYNDKAAGEDTYNTISVPAKYEGRFVYTGKMYTNRADSDGNMNFALARLYVNYGSGGVYDGSLVITDKINKLKANRWYDFRYEINLYKTKNNFSVEFTPSQPLSDGDTGFSETGTLGKKVLGKLGFRGGRFDFDLNSKDATKFVAYKDLKLTHTKNPGKIDTYVNGNVISDGYKNGIYTAEGSGSGLFALAVYEDDELISLDVSYSEEELETRKLNAVIKNGAEKTVKIFRFDEDNTPYCINAEPLYDSSEETRIYANYDFSKEGDFSPSSTRFLSDGQLYLKSSGLESEGSYSRPRFGVSAMNPGRYFIFEADYSIPENQAKTHKVRLMGGYYHSAVSGSTSEVDTYVATTTGGMIHSARNSSETFGTLSSTPTNIAIKIDLVENKYDIYINRVCKSTGNRLLPAAVKEGTQYGTRSFYIGHLSGDNNNSYCIGTLIVDNIKIYEGTEFKDIGNKIPNVHHTDYSDISPDGTSSIYKRPEASEIAKNVLGASHPRLLLNKEKVEEFKNSTDPFVKDIVERTIAYADSMLDKSIDTEDGVPYEMDGTSVENLPESRRLMMSLGLAYLLTGDKKYSDRAYEEAELMFDIYSLIDKSKGDVEGNRDYWNSYSCLDVTEIPQILSICYDWMYDAWTTGQKEEIIKHVMEKGIDNMYRNYYNMYLPSYTNASWWNTKNNQGGVCNGSAIMTAIAFMEEDAHRCSQIAEAGIRALEITLSNFAPDGGWMESASYWRYTLEFVTMAAATLDSVCATNYGLQNTIGLRNSCFYSLAIEGETGAMSFGDGSGDATNAPFLFYWAKAYKDKSIGAAAMYIKNNFTPGIYDLVYYDANYIGEYELPEFFYYRGTEMVSMRSGNQDKETYIVTTGGKGHSTGHDHLDSGHIILEMNGERVFKDMGAEHYQANGYFAANRYLYFRARTEGHNIFVINPYKDAKNYPGQDTKAISTVTEYDASGKSATMDLSDAYARDAKKAERIISLEGKDAVIEDTIVLSDAGDIYWNWYVTVKNNKYDTSETAGSVEISDDGKYAIVTQRKNLSDTGRKFKVSFDTSCDYTLSVEAADYYVDVMPETSKSHKKDNERSKRLVVYINGDAGEEIKLKTIVESMD